MRTSDLPLRGPAIYNPHLLSRDELKGLFVARQGLLNELLEDLRKTPPKGIPQHQLLIGVRGMGKTMLLRRFQVAVEQDKKLSKLWLPLAFPEEQYNVANLADFWLNCLDALSDALESRGDRELVEELDESIDSLRKLPAKERAGQALRLLQEAGKKQKRRLILLVDNADLIFDRIGEEEWGLREALSSPHSFAFVGASAVVAESTYQYGKAFYDFFKVHELAGLSLEETETLLKNYATTRGDAEVERIVQNDPGRIKTLHNLTGGNPRTLVLLYNVLAAGEDGDARSDLEQLLDLCTPLYKARFEEMSAQAQKIVHALALRWDPATAADLAADTGLDINTISGQLGRLSHQGVVQKVPYDPDSKTGFQVAERFFNIWYLMRASRRVRRRLIWLVEFLKAFYSRDELEQRALRDLELGNSLDWEQRYAEFSFGLVQPREKGMAVECEVRPELELNIRHAAFEYPKGIFSNFVEKLDRASFREVLALCSSFVFLGQESVVARIFDELDLSERWRPLRAALEARIRGSRNHLNRVSPEVRRPAIEILDELELCAECHRSIPSGTDSDVPYQAS